jgi:hypothetical protein
MPGLSRLNGIAAVLFVALLMSAAYGADDKSVMLVKSPTGAVLRSLAVPGWGQLYCHSYIKALAFATAEVSIIYSASFQHGQMKRFQRAAENVPPELRTQPQRLIFNPYYDSMRTYEGFYRNSRNRLIWWLAGTIMLSMGDAYVDAQLYGLDFSPQIDNKTGAVGLTVSCNF